MPESPFRRLPSVSVLLAEPALAALRVELNHDTVAEAVRDVLADARNCIGNGNPHPNLDSGHLAEQVAVRLRATRPLQLRRVINATGIVLHTNLGRSPLAEIAAKAAYDAARGYLNLELSLESGKRSSRQDPIRDGVYRLTGAESATAVNNCAAATVIVLRALAMGKEVVVSRGELIEIGGSFRIPDIMTVSGATLREVGTTNITRLRDYERAIGPNTGLLMRIHTSNFRIRGFTEKPSIGELVALGKKHGIPVVDDAGSGQAFDLAPYGLTDEPTVREGLDAGADLVLFSGDKLLGGPQAGIIAGKKESIERIERDPLMRAFRLDKMTLAALEATLKLYRNPATVRTAVPTLRMLTMPIAELRIRCVAFAERLQEAAPALNVTVREDVAYVGGGSLPDQALPTCVVSLMHPSQKEGEFAAKLRTGVPAVMGRVHAGRVELDLRTVFDEQEQELFEAVVGILRGG